MDASVNMKMTPDEHRLIRECLIEVRDEAERLVREGEVPLGDTVRPIMPAERRDAREKHTRISDLLAKL